MLSAPVVLINGGEGGVLLRVEDGGAQRHVPLLEFPLNRVSLNGSPVGSGVEFQIGLVVPRIDLSKIWDWNGKVIPLQLEKERLAI